MFIVMISLYKQFRSCGLNFFLIASSTFGEIKFSMQVANLSDILLLEE